jgi:hypothetical protein
MSHARDTPSRPRRSRSLTPGPQDEEGNTSPLSRTASKLFGRTESSAERAEEEGVRTGRRRVDVGRPGETPREIKEVLLTPAEIRRARTFDPSDPVVYAERKAEEAAEAAAAAEATAREKGRRTYPKAGHEVRVMGHRLMVPSTANLAAVALLLVGLLIKLVCFSAGDPTGR